MYINLRQIRVVTLFLRRRRTESIYKNSPPAVQEGEEEPNDGKEFKTPMSPLPQFSGLSVQHTPLAPVQNLFSVYLNPLLNQQSKLVLLPASVQE